MLAACHLLLALQPAVQEPEVVESTTDDGIHIRYEVKPDAQGATIRRSQINKEHLDELRLWLHIEEEGA